MSPRPAVERVARSIRLRKDVDEELVRRSAAAGLSVNAYVQSLLGFGNAEVVSQKPGVGPAACPHPRKSRQVFSWGSKCGECGRRL